jgi:hypothetical protein
MDYLCRLTGGTCCAADDASRVEWFELGEIDALKITQGTPAVIRKAFSRLREDE